MRKIIALSAALLLAACDPVPAPIDNAAATNCVPGTPSEHASSLCKDVELSNGVDVVAPDNFAETRDELPASVLANAVSNAD